MKRHLIPFVIAVCLLAPTLLACTRTSEAPTAPTEISATSTPVATFTSQASPTPEPSATPEPSPTPGTPPQVTASNPISGDLTMQGDRPIVLVFDQPMDQASLQDSLILTPAIEVAVGWEAPDRAVIIAAGGWTADMYELTVLPGVRSLSGVVMGEPYNLSFETGGYGVPVPILMYHNIKDFEDASQVSEEQLAWTVRETAFTEQMHYLRDNGWHSISPQQLIDYFGGAPLPSKPVIISMDDGWVSLLTRAWPVFLETGLRPVVYIVAAFPTYGSETDYLVWDQLRELVAQGMWVGCHSYSHYSMYELSPEDLHHEVFDARDEIEAQLGVKLDSFSYPFGAYGDETVAEVQAAGFTSAVTLNPVGYQEPAEPYRLNRLQIDYSMTLEQFIETVNGNLGKFLYTKGSR
ncbi:MAG: polysaccharide deacetylase family protein [Chloroflexi bacterium]|nr:polysaccharide deacetylase family protein [Chloroflexota bacterium]